MKRIYLQGAGDVPFWRPSPTELSETIRNDDLRFIGSLSLHVTDYDATPQVIREMSFYVHSKEEMTAIYRDHVTGIAYCTLGDVTRKGYLTVSDGCGGEGLLHTTNLVPMELGIKYAVEFLETETITLDKNWEPSRYNW